MSYFMAQNGRVGTQEGLHEAGESVKKWRDKQIIPLVKSTR
jgi:hypothetical protein